MNARLITVLLACMLSANLLQAQVLTNGVAESITRNTATVYTAPNPLPVPDILYYGAMDGDTNLNLWAYSSTVSFIEVPSGRMAAQLQSLVPGQLYYYRWATNGTWAEASSNFTTLNSPGSLPPSSTRMVAVDSNGVVVAPSTFIVANRLVTTNYSGPVRLNGPLDPAGNIWMSDTFGSFYLGLKTGSEAVSGVAYMMFDHPTDGGGSIYLHPAPGKEIILGGHVNAAGNIISNAAIVGATLDGRGLYEFFDADNIGNRSSWSVSQLSAPTNAINMGGQVSTNVGAWHGPLTVRGRAWLQQLTLTNGIISNATQVLISAVRKPWLGTEAGLINLDGGGDVGSDGGSILMYGAPDVDYSTGGSLLTYGGHLSNFTAAPGGSILTYGDTGGAGGAIDTHGGGGSISTRGLGEIQLGTAGTRTTVSGTATNDIALSLPPRPGTLALNEPVLAFCAITNAHIYSCTTTYQPVTNWLEIATNRCTTTSSNITVNLDGWYDLGFQVSFDGEVSTPHYEMEITTNGIGIDAISTERDTSSTLTGSASGTGLLYLPAGTRLGLQLKADGNKTATILKAQLRAHRIQ